MPMKKQPSRPPAETPRADMNPPAAEPLPHPGHLQPATDRCPYPRPFPPEFGDCEAYQPISFIPTDSLGRPLQRAWTCRNLEASAFRQGTAYPRCRIGDAAARERWAESVGPRREIVSQIRLALVAASRTQLDAFLAEQRDAARLSDDERERRLQPLAEALIASMHFSVDAMLERFQAAEFPVATAKAVLAEMVWNWVRSPQPITTLAAPPSLIARHPEVKELLAPES